MADEIEVEVAFAGAQRQDIIALQVVAGTTAREAILRSGMLKAFPEIDLARNKVGVYGKLVGLDCVLRQGDRVEIYRPLLADAKQARRRRAVRAKALKKPNDEKLKP